nr:copia protein [Tanacetum cinerariifolium]
MTLKHGVLYTHFKTNPPAGPDDTNILAGTQPDDSDSECDEQVILVPSFPFNSFSGPTIQDVFAPMENNLDYAEELARLQRQEYEAHSAVAKHGFEFSVDTAALLPQANIEICRNLVPAAGDLAGGIVPTGGVPSGSDPASSVPTGGVLVGSSIPTSSVPTGRALAGCSIPASSVLAGGDLTGSSVPASDVPAGSFPARRVPAGGILAGSLVSTNSCASSVPAASVLIPAVVSTDSAATSPLPPVHSLGFFAHTTRFPTPFDLGNHQHRAGIFSSSSYNDDFCADVTNLDSNVAVDPIATRRINSIHPQSHILRDLYSVANAFADLDWVAAITSGMPGELWFAIKPDWWLKAIGKRRALIMMSFVWTSSSTKGLVYVDDIIFGSTNKAWCDEFEVLMKGEFKMSAMGELAFFLGLQVKQLPDGIFISQDKYVKDMLKKFYMETSQPDIMFACKKQTVVATSFTEAEYVAAASCCGQVRADDLVSAGGCSLPAGSYSFLLLDWFFLVVLLVHADEFVSAGGCSLPAGSYSFLLLDWFLLVVFWATATIRTLEEGPVDIIATIDGNEVVVPPEKEHSPVRDPTLVREPSPRPELKPTPDSPSPLSPPPSLAEVGPTTSSRPPSPSRPPSGPADIREGGGNFPSSPPSNEAPQTPAATAVGGAEDSATLTALTLKLDRCLHIVKTLENELGVTKKVLGDSEGEDATTSEQEFDLAALHTLASATLGDDPSATAAHPDAKTTMPVYNTRTTRRRLRKPFTSSVSAHVSETIPAGVRVPATASTIPATSSVDAAVRAAPSPSIPTAADKGKAPMVDNSLPVDLLSEQERVLKNLYDSQLGEELAKKIQAEQESEFARQQEERSTFRPKPTLDAPPAKRANQKAPAVSAQDPADDPLTAPAHGSSEPTVAAPTPSSLRHRRKHIAKKRVTPIVDVADAAMIKFDNDSDSDDDPLPYAPYVGCWRLYPRAQVHVLKIVDGRVIHMFIDVSYPLSVGTLEHMLKHGLEVSKLLVRGDLTMAEQLICFIKAALLNAKSAA